MARLNRMFVDSLHPWFRMIETRQIEEASIEIMWIEQSQMIDQIYLKSIIIHPWAPLKYFYSVELIVKRLIG